MERTNRFPQVNRSQVERILKPVIAFILLIWFIEVVDRLLFSGGLDQFGIIPRQFVGLRGIIFAPFLHGGFDHLLANTIPLIVLGILAFLRSGRKFWLITAIILLTSGTGVWIFGPAQSVHVGASGLIFGFFAYLVAVAYYDRSFPAIVIAILVILVYGGIFWGIIPQDNGVSWQGHLFGLIGGIIAARVTTNML